LPFGPRAPGVRLALGIGVFCPLRRRRIFFSGLYVLREVLGLPFPVGRDLSFLQRLLFLLLLIAQQLSRM